MTLPLTFSNVVQLFSIFAPLFLGTFLVLVSVFNQNIKGIIYLSGVLLASVISYAISSMIGSAPLENESQICNIMESPIIPSQYRFNIPNYNSMFISFTLIYLLLPMLSNNQINFWIIGVIVSIFSVDAYVKLTHFCTVPRGITIGAIIGLTLGAVWYFILKLNSFESLLFFHDLTSNNVVCKRPSNQTFKCSVYKNGQVLQDL
jgi:hypothetical protein